MNIIEVRILAFSESGKFQHGSSLFMFELVQSCLFSEGHCNLVYSCRLSFNMCSFLIVTTKTSPVIVSSRSHFSILKSFSYCFWPNLLSKYLPFLGVHKVTYFIEKYLRIQSYWNVSIRAKQNVSFLQIVFLGYILPL